MKMTSQCFSIKNLVSLYTHAIFCHTENCITQTGYQHVSAISITGVTLYAKIRHMLGNVFFFAFLMLMGTFTPFAPSWKVLSELPV